MLRSLNTPVPWTIRFWWTLCCFCQWNHKRFASLHWMVWHGHTKARGLPLAVGCEMCLHMEWHDKWRSSPTVHSVSRSLLPPCMLKSPLFCLKMGSKRKCHILGKRKGKTKHPSNHYQVTPGVYRLEHLVCLDHSFSVFSQYGINICSWLGKFQVYLSFKAINLFLSLTSPNKSLFFCLVFPKFPKAALFHHSCFLHSEGVKGTGGSE